MKKKVYKQLTLEEREQIHQMLWDKLSVREIACQLGRNASTISREINRNTPPIKRRYTPHIAQEKYQRRKRESRQRPRLKSPEIVEYVKKKMINEQWSPEQVAGRWSKEHKELPISHEAIYQYVYASCDPKEKGDLRPYLRRKHKRRRRKYIPYKELRKQRIRNRVSIEHRPKVVEKRKQFGHWEGDTVESSRKSKAGLNTLVERKSRLLNMTKLKGKTAEETAKAVATRLGGYPKGLRRTLTLDNGRENADHEDITKETQAQCYFAHPYHSWERGTNENTNGLIRQYFPKGIDFSQISDEQIQQVENLLNNRPRKCLNYQTPNEVFQRAVALTC